MNVTNAQEKRVEKIMKQYAKGEDINIKFFGDALYVYGSELGCLRIFAHYLNNGNIQSSKYRVGYSDNLKTYFFCMDLYIS